MTNWLVSLALLRIVLVVVVLSVSLPVSAFAQSIDTDRAQGEMYSRVDAAVTAFARRIGAGNDLLDYCWLELHLHTRQHPVDGFIPFGVNYNNIRSQTKLNLVIVMRETYERTYLSLCIARAKRDLDAVE